MPAPRKNRKREIILGVKRTRMREIEPTIFKNVCGRTPTPPAKKCPPHIKKAADSHVCNDIPYHGAVVVRWKNTM